MKRYYIHFPLVNFDEGGSLLDKRQAIGAIIEKLRVGKEMDWIESFIKKTEISVVEIREIEEN
jgi:hypothetical protein